MISSTKFLFGICFTTIFPLHSCHLPSSSVSAMRLDKHLQTEIVTCICGWQYFVSKPFFVRSMFIPLLEPVVMRWRLAAHSLVFHIIVRFDFHLPHLLFTGMTLEIFGGIVVVLSGTFSGQLITQHHMRVKILSYFFPLQKDLWIWTVSIFNNYILFLEFHWQHFIYSKPVIGAAVNILRRHVKET